MAEKPNVLFITTDQQRWDTLSLYGSPDYRTPDLDRPAAEGVLFERAYCPTPVRTPAPVSTTTRQYPTRHGAYQIGMEAVPNLEGPTLGRLLSGGGYGTALIGETHFVARFLEEQHVSGVKEPEISGKDPSNEFRHEFDGPYLGFDFVRHYQSHTSDQPPNAHSRAWLEDKGPGRDYLHSKRENSRSTRRIRRAASCGEWEIDAEHTQTAWIAESIEWDGKSHIYRHYAASRSWGEEFIDPNCPHKSIPAHSPSEWVETAFEAIRAYIGTCTMLDEYTGRLLSTLGERENTLIVFSTGHGDNLGRHGLWGNGVGAYADDQRIPAKASWPANQTKAVGGTRSAFNLVDVLPTFLDADADADADTDADGVAPPPFVQGIGQIPVIRGEMEMPREWAMVDFLATPTLHQQTFVQGDYKLVVYMHASYGELYDLSKDPDQCDNLFDDPDYRSVMLSLIRDLVRANMGVAGTQPQRISHA